MVLGFGLKGVGTTTGPRNSKGLAALVEMVAEPGVGLRVEMAEGIALTVSPLSPRSSMVSGCVLERAGNDDSIWGLCAALGLGLRLTWLGDGGLTKGIERIAAFTEVVHSFRLGVEMAGVSVKVHRSYRSNTPRTRS